MSAEIFPQITVLIKQLRPQSGLPEPIPKPDPDDIDCLVPPLKGGPKIPPPRDDD